MKSIYGYNMYSDHLYLQVDCAISAIKLESRGVQRAPMGTIIPQTIYHYNEAG